MQMVRLLWGALLAIFLLGIALWVSGLASHCCSAREEPSRMEIFVARLVRTWSLPASARQSKNPLASSPQLLQDASRHFADHCASCHANDGSGNTEIGRNLYPRAPDMRLPATQQLSDGELFNIIHNGIRWTGMPAWGESGDDPDSWKLVQFIRHLPDLSQDELREMERFNPKSAAERDEEKQEQDFLHGAPTETPAPKHR